MNYCVFSSFLGNIKLVEEDGFLVELSFTDEKIKECCSKFLIDVKNQLKEYFIGKRKVFNVKLKFKGTDFQIKVWNELLKIPYGETRAYKDIAISIGNEKAYRAVGNANNKNKIAIIVPCHRVIGSNGNLVGYAGGTYKKKKLLEIENF